MFKFKIGLLLIILSSKMAIGQANNQNLDKQKRTQERIDKLVGMSKDSLIELAAKKVTKPSFNKNDFDRVEAWATENSVFVKFSHIIQVVPQKGRNYFSVTVDLLHPRSSFSELGGAPDKNEIEFYKPNAEDKKKIDFVRTAINNSNGQIGRLEDQLPDETMTIDEKDTYYIISVNSETTSSNYKIDKTSMKIYDDMHRHEPSQGFDECVKKIF